MSPVRASTWTALSGIQSTFNDEATVTPPADLFIHLMNLLTI